MEERSDSNLDFFNMIKDGKIVPFIKINSASRNNYNNKNVCFEI